VIRRYSYSVPSSGILDLIPLDRPAILESICASLETDGTANAASLRILDGSGGVVFGADVVIVSVATPTIIQFLSATDAGNINTIGNTSIPMAALIPRDLVVLVGEKVRLTFADDMVFSGVVVTWRDLE